MQSSSILLFDDMGLIVLLVELQLQHSNIEIRFRVLV